ncbi:hypothetical protein ACOSQ4_022413 [Xanthoceras sorbifolium]
MAMEDPQAIVTKLEATNQWRTHYFFYLVETTKMSFAHSNPNFTSRLQFTSKNLTQVQTHVRSKSSNTSNPPNTQLKKSPQSKFKSHQNTLDQSKFYVHVLKYTENKTKGEKQKKKKNT